MYNIGMQFSMLSEDCSLNGSYQTRPYACWKHTDYFYQMKGILDIIMIESDLIIPKLGVQSIEINRVKHFDLVHNLL